MNRKALLLITLLVEGGLFVFGLLWMGGLDAMLSRFSLSWSATGFVLLLCFPLLITLLFSVRIRWKPLSHLVREMEERVLPIFSSCTYFDLAFIAFFAGLGEELFFRGWLQGVLAVKFGIWFGILMASALFGFAHYLSTTYAIYALLTGLYLGVIYQVSGNLFIVMAIHAVYDFTALVYLIRRAKSRNMGMEPSSVADRK